jgi:site-specific DNA-adenine methylase
MTSYHGGKIRIGRDIAQVIYQVASEVERQTGVRFKGYVEPFCGMLGVYRHIPALFEGHRPPLKYQAGDINGSVVKMWKASQKGWVPPVKCTKKRFYELKGNGQSSAEKGFIGHACSYRSTYFSTFFDKANIKYASNQVIETTKFVSDVKFSHGSYEQFSKIKGYIIYCDPPYFQGSNYWNEAHKFQTFNYEFFYTWVEKMSEHNLVLLSERAKLPYTLVATFTGNEKLYLINNLNLV